MIENTLEDIKSVEEENSENTENKILVAFENAIVVNLSFFGKPKFSRIENERIKNKKSSPEDILKQIILEIPSKIQKLREKDYSLFLDSVESFVYNNLTKRFRSEVSHCQIWIS